VLAACGSDSGGGGPIPIGSLQASYNAYYCNLAVRCGLIADLASCSGLRPVVTVNPNLIAAAEAGAVTYDGAAAATCLAGLTSTCDRSLLAGNRNAPEACDHIFTGTVGDQGACMLNEECISNVCIPSTGCTMACCPGTCYGATAPARPALGQSCSTNTNCIDSYCETTTYTCAALLANGATCTGDEQCAIGLACTSTTRTCGPLAAVGATCSTDDNCRSVGNYCGPAGKCVAFGLTGDSCAAGEQCSMYYTCGGTTCALRPKLGDSCGGTSQGCIDLSYCDPTTQKCTALKPDGATCNGSNECKGGMCQFSTTTGTCMTPAARF
jgi:hypothetical protein